jgi:folate-binding protein YgfZ
MSDPILLSDRALITVTGPDWRSFLQGLVSQNVDTLMPGELRYGALLSPQGRILFDLFLMGEEDGCLIDAPAKGRDALIQRLKLYRLRAKVEITPDDRRAVALLDGSGGGGWLADPRLPALGYRSYLQEGSGDLKAHEMRRLALGVPGPTDWGTDRLYALEANLDLLNAIDFHKGCFIGQETASRMKRRGQIKSRTLPVIFEGAAPPPGTEVRAGEHRAGEILSGQEGRALALLRLDRIEGQFLTAAGLEVRVDQPSWLPAEISSRV